MELDMGVRRRAGEQLDGCERWKDNKKKIHPSHDKEGGTTREESV